MWGKTLDKAPKIKAFIAAGGSRAEAMRQFHCAAKTVTKFAGRHVRILPPTADGNVKWTSPMVTVLVKAWNIDGLTQTECARRLGVGKNHVAGQIQRLRDEGVFMVRRGSPIKARADG